MSWRISTFLLVVLGATLASAGGKVRTWTSADGRTMQAEFVSELDGDVTFLKDGKLIVLRAEKLSKQDQQDIKDLAAGKQPKEDPFSAPGAGGGTPGKVNPVGEGPAESDKPKKAIAVQTRTWTDRFGLKSSGKFVRVDGNDVVLSRGARVITVPFANLSDEDQDYVRNLLTSQGKEADIPSEKTFAGGEGAGSNLPGGDNGFPATGRGGISGPGMPGVPGGIGGMPPGMAPGVGGMAGGMPPGAFPPGGMGGMGRGGPRGGPGMGGGIGMPPGMAPPETGGPGMPGSGPLTGPDGIGGRIGGPIGSGFPGSGFPGSDPTGGGLGSSDRMPGMGMPPSGGMPGMIPESPDLAGSGLGSFPRSRLPSLEPASIPPISSPTFPGMQMEEYYQCSKCNAKLSKLEAAGSSCPRCNATWGFKQDQFGRKTMTAAGSGQMATVGVVIVIFVLVGMAVVIAVFIGIIVAIVKAASAPARPPQPMPQQRYY
ncbi:MAG: hypothetical protein ACR2FY_23645 [Pirellulaceae bacterium]